MTRLKVEKLKHKKLENTEISKDKKYIQPKINSQNITGKGVL